MLSISGAQYQTMRAHKRPKDNSIALVPDAVGCKAATRSVLWVMGDEVSAWRGNPQSPVWTRDLWSGAVAASREWMCHLLRG